MASADSSQGYFVSTYSRSVFHTDIIPHLPVAFVGPILIFCAPPLLLFLSEEYQIPYSHSFGVTALAFVCVVGFVVSRILHLGLQKRPSICYSLDRYREKLQTRNPSPVACNKGPERALTAFQIFDLMNEFQQYIRDRNLYYIDSSIVRPLTSEVELSLAELLGPSRTAWFVSHYWGTRFTYTCDALKRHAETVAASGENLTCPVSIY